MRRRLLHRKRNSSDYLILSLQIHHEVVAVATKGLPHSVQALASQLASTSKLQLDKVDCNKVSRVCFAARFRFFVSPFWVLADGPFLGDQKTAYCVSPEDINSFADIYCRPSCILAEIQVGLSV